MPLRCMEGEVKNMRVVGALICLGVLVAGCGGTQQILRQTRGDKLYEAVSTHSSQVVSGIDSRSHTADRRLPMGVPTSDWSHLYSVASTSLVDTDPQTGATLSTMPLGGAYHLPAATANGVPGGLAPNGMWLVVESIDSSQSHMLIVNTTTSTVRRKIDLDGYFQFDAISNDGDRLYLIQHLNGREYYVRLYDVIGGRLDENIVVDKSDGKTLVVGGPSGVAWIDTSSLHVRAQALTDWRVSSLGLSPNGQNLYAVGDGGRIAEISMADPSVISRFDPSVGQPMALMRVAA